MTTNDSEGQGKDSTRYGDVSQAFSDEAKDINSKKRLPTESRSSHRSSHIRGGSTEANITGRAVTTYLQRAQIEMENTGLCRQLVKDGRWIVPVGERMKGWEKLGLKEIE